MSERTDQTMVIQAIGRVVLPPWFWHAVGGAVVAVMTLLAIALPTPSLPEVHVAMIGNSMMVCLFCSMLAQSWLLLLFVLAFGRTRCTSYSIQYQQIVYPCHFLPSTQYYNDMPRFMGTLLDQLLGTSSSLFVTQSFATGFLL